MAKCSPLHKVADAARWDAEDLFGRLCIVVHAAFLYAGLVPNCPPAATPWSLSRGYSVLPPEKGRRQDEAAAVVLRLYRPWGRRRGSRAHMVLRSYITADGGRYMERRERLGYVAVETFLSGGVDETARTLIRAPGSAGGRLWKLLTEGICRGLFLYACEANGVPVMPDFASLPRDIKVAILEKLDDGRDVAMVESASKELRDLVAGHGSDLWKLKYEAVISSCPDYFPQHPVRGKGTPLITWKERYVMARHSMLRLLQQQRREQDPFYRLPPLHQMILREAAMIPKPRRSIRKIVHEAQKPMAQRRAAVEEKSQRSRARRTMTTVPRLYSREHQAGAGHSPSSGYQWKHR